VARNQALALSTQVRLITTSGSAARGCLSAASSSLASGIETSLKVAGSAPEPSASVRRSSATSIHDAEGHVNAPLVGPDQVGQQEGLRYGVEGSWCVFPFLECRVVRLTRPDKLGRPINRFSNKIGSEAFWPTTLDKESNKAARILKSFCSKLLGAALVFAALLTRKPRGWILRRRRVADGPGRRQGQTESFEEDSAKGYSECRWPCHLYGHALRLLDFGCGWLGCADREARGRNVVATVRHSTTYGRIGIFGRR
jgi:hypothetical protein